MRSSLRSIHAISEALRPLCDAGLRVLGDRAAGDGRVILRYPEIHGGSG